MVYRAGLIPGAGRPRWRAGGSRFAAIGHAPIFIMAQSFGERDPRDYGMDAAVEFPPHKLTEHLPQLNGSLRMLDFAADARIFELRRRGRGLGPVAPAVPADPHGAAGLGQRCAAAGAGHDDPWRDAGLVSGLAVAPDRDGGGAEGGRRGAGLHQCLERVGRGRLSRAGRAFRRGVPQCDGAGGERRGADTAGVAVAAGGARRVHRPGRNCCCCISGGRWSDRGVGVSFLLLGGGPLEAEYRAVAPTTLFAGAEELARHAAALAASGFRSAIVNTSAGGARLRGAGGAWDRLHAAAARDAAAAARAAVGRGGAAPAWRRRGMWCSRPGSCATATTS